MLARHATTIAVLGIVLLAGCEDGSDPTRVAGPRSSAWKHQRHQVVVDPNASGHGVAATIQQGIDMVEEGGVVRVKPGVYTERVVITKGVTITSIGDGEGPAIISQSQPSAAHASEAVILIETPNRVVLRDFTVHHDNIRGVNLLRDGELVVDRMRFEGIATGTLLVGNGVSAHYGAGTTGKRAKVVVINSQFAVGGIGISLGGDVDGFIYGNEIRQSVSRLPCFIVSPVGQGATALTTPGTRTDVQVLNNLFEDCGSDRTGRFTMVIVNGTLGASTTGTINIIGNTFRHTTPTACAGAGVLFAFYSGVVAHNKFENVVQECAPVTGPNNERAAVYVGHRIDGMRAAQVAVRYNDFVDNAYAALRIGKNQTEPIDARCNWWGGASGPSSASASESFNGIVVQPGGAAPDVTPFATRPVARTFPSC